MFCSRKTTFLSLRTVTKIIFGSNSAHCVPLHEAGILPRKLFSARYKWKTVLNFVDYIMIEGSYKGNHIGLVKPITKVIFYKERTRSFYHCHYQRFQLDRFSIILRRMTVTKLADTAVVRLIAVYERLKY